MRLARISSVSYHRLNVGAQLTEDERAAIDAALASVEAERAELGATADQVMRVSFSTSTPEGGSQ
jgi:hypothetical protein